ncbi:MAG: hypothetical protein AAGN82_25210 [Myxococcota bacterium]
MLTRRRGSFWGRARGVDALGPPFDDPITGAATGVGFRARSHERRWRRRRATLERHRDDVVEVCAQDDHPFAVPSAWVLALLWDELARRDITEAATDALLHWLGRDPSVGIFQITGATARDVVAFARWGGPHRQRSPAELRERLLEPRFAARVATARVQQIIVHWQQAGFDPQRSGGLGPHRTSAIALVGTLYSQGLGQPKKNPRANARGLQVASFAARLSDDVR